MYRAPAEARTESLVTLEEAGLLIPVLAQTARISLHNSDPDVAAELCEVMTAVGLALRGSPPTVPTALLRRGVAWVELVLELLGTGAWTAGPAHLAAAEQDAHSAAGLHADLGALKALLDLP